MELHLALTHQYDFVNTPRDTRFQETLLAILNGDQDTKKYLEAQDN